MKKLFDFDSKNSEQKEINRIRRDYHEDAPKIDFEAFQQVIASRRSIRRFTREPIPDEVVRDCIALAHLAPNSSSLHPWEFYRVKTEETKLKLAEFCMSQPAASTASELIVCVARTDTWRRNSLLVLEEMNRVAEPSERTITYYKKLLWLQLYTGFLSWWVPIKFLIYNIPALIQPMTRFPLTKSDVKIWAIKSTALACENMMLAFRAHGYDTCAMEGFDEPKVKRLLKLSRHAHITMVVAAGKRAQGGVYGPRIRLPLDKFYFEV